MFINILIPVIVAVVVGTLAFFYLGVMYRKNVAEAQFGSAEQKKARKIVDDAIKEGEALKREARLDLKDETIRIKKNDLDKEVKERRNEITQLERRIQKKEETIDRKADAIEKKKKLNLLKRMTS